MIAHCELMGDRMAILDPPPDLQRPAGAGLARRRGRLRLQVRRAVLALDQGLRPADAAQPITVPPSGHMAGIWARNDATRGVHKAPANEVVRGAIGARAPDHQGRAGPAQPGRRQLHPRLPRPRHPGLGRAHAVERPGVALHQRAAAVQLRRGVDHARARSGCVFEPNDPSLWAAPAAHDHAAS